MPPSMISTLIRLKVQQHLSPLLGGPLVAKISEDVAKELTLVLSTQTADAASAP